MIIHKKRRHLSVPKFGKGLILPAVVVVIILAIVGGGFYTIHWYHNGLQPASSQSRRIQVTVAPGDGPADIINLLASKGLIRNKTAFSWYLDHSLDKNDLQAGTYLLSPTMTAQQIVTTIAEGKVDTYQLTLIPGKYLSQIEASLESAGFTKAQVTVAFNQSYNSPLFAGKPAGTSLEGYIFPDTYNLSATSTVSDLLNKIFTDFYQQIQVNDIIPKLQAEGLNLYQGITLASIVQQEVADYPDQQIVAQVFLSRLKQNISLGSDVTAKYASYLAGVPFNVTINSPYNTRVVTGLPPGPIGNFNVDALMAVANPAPTNYLFFVAGDNGQMHYSDTQAEQNQNIAEYCTVLCQN
jgi:UPF0755 protein